ncbi:sulfide/dihydroorotate dehydrogenase-like FAD/NAD-binding protein [Candidatus Omnitrophota bacterium]
MFKVIHKEVLAQGIQRIEIQAELIARKACAGQFVVVIVDEKGERIPLTLADWNKEKGTIGLIFQEVGYSTRRLGKLKVGDSIFTLLGPLGNATDVKEFGTVVCVGGGVGIAEVYPISRAFKSANNEVIGIIGSRDKNLIILEQEMKDVCDQLYVTTDDGSYGRKGFVTEVLKELLQANKHIDLVYAIGPVVMMKAISELTRPQNIKTIVNLNPIMVDATGMCGACRCKVGEKTVFGCVDGPEFNGHLVDFAELQSRLNAFKKQEGQINETFD